MGSAGTVAGDTSSGGTRATASPQSMACHHPHLRPPPPPTGVKSPHTRHPPPTAPAQMRHTNAKATRPELCSGGALQGRGSREHAGEKRDGSLRIVNAAASADHPR